MEREKADIDKYRNYELPFGEFAGVPLKALPFNYLYDLRESIRLEIIESDVENPMLEDIFIHLVGFFEVASDQRRGS